jgi:ribosome-associated toxin RatA of RatAB toxin-antitoxin module
MALVERSVLVAYSAQQMYTLVDAVERYPEFLPWCGGTTLEHRDVEFTRASILIDFHGIRQSFETENRNQPPTRIEIRLVSGPFRTLDGTWQFSPLAAQACRIDFRLHYEFSNKLLEKLVGPVFGHIASTFVDAFVKRAERLYEAT